MSFVLRVVVASLVGCVFGYFGNKFFGSSPAPQVVQVRSEGSAPLSALNPKLAEDARQPVAGSDSEEPVFVTGFGYKLGRYNISLSDGTHRTELDGTVVNFGRNFVELSDLGVVWVKGREIAPREEVVGHEVAEVEPVPVEIDSSIEDVKAEWGPLPHYSEPISIPRVEFPEFKL